MSSIAQKMKINTANKKKSMRQEKSKALKFMNLLYN